MPSLSPTTRASLLRSTAESFVKAFIAGTSPTSILNTYFTSSAQIHEHGPTWANARLPFLGKTFTGRRQPGSPPSDDGRTCDDYYDILTRTLSYHPNDETVPASERFVVDAEALGPGGEEAGRGSGKRGGDCQDEGEVQEYQEWAGVGRGVCVCVKWV